MHTAAFFVGELQPTNPVLLSLADVQLSGNHLRNQRPVALHGGQVGEKLAQLCQFDLSGSGEDGLVESSQNEF